MLILNFMVLFSVTRLGLNLGTMHLTSAVVLSDFVFILVLGKLYGWSVDLSRVLRKLQPKLLALAVKFLILCSERMNLGS